MMVIVCPDAVNFFETEWCYRIGRRNAVSIGLNFVELAGLVEAVVCA